jgi:hypothetical protein
MMAAEMSQLWRRLTRPARILRGSRVRQARTTLYAR